MVESLKWTTFPPSKDEVYKRYQELLNAFWTAEDSINLIKSQNVNDGETIKELEIRKRDLDRQLVLINVLIKIYFGD
jgi:hypothetical protein